MYRYLICIGKYLYSTGYRGQKKKEQFPCCILEKSTREGFFDIKDPKIFGSMIGIIVIIIIMFAIVLYQRRRRKSK